MQLKPPSMMKTNSQKPTLIEKFSAATLQQAIEAVKQKWGSDAVILHVEKRKEAKKFLSRSQEWVEVTARPPEPVSNPLPTREEAMPGQMFEEMHSLRDEVQQCRTTMRQMERIHWARSQMESKPLQHPLLDFMVSKGFSKDYAMELLVDWTNGNPNLDLAQCIADLDRRLPRTGWNDLFPKGEGRCTLFLGFPGIGKTLLLLKIAARMRLMQQSDVLIVSADMTRPGPSQELALYSEVLEIPVRHLFSGSDLRSLAGEMTPRTQLLIDWNGISPYSLEAWKALEEISAQHPQFQMILTASLPSDVGIWESFCPNLEKLPMAGLALTQGDLEVRLGKVWEAQRSTRLPIAFFSSGKNVPGELFEGKAFPFGKSFFHGYSAAESPKPTAVSA